MIHPDQHRKPSWIDNDTSHYRLHQRDNSDDPLPELPWPAPNIITDEDERLAQERSDLRMYKAIPWWFKLITMIRR